MDDDTPIEPDAVRPAGEESDDALAGLLGGLDMNALLGMAGEVQQQMADAQARAAATEVEGSAGGGVVTITLTGALECRAVHIEESTTDDVSMLEDLVLSALRDALAKAKAAGGEDPLGGLGNQLGDLFGD